MRVVAVLGFLGLSLLASCSSGANPQSTPTALEPEPTRLVAPATTTPHDRDSLSELVFIDRLHGVAVKDCVGEPLDPPCRLVSTNDGGRTWTQEYFPTSDNAVLYDLQFLDNQHGFVVQNMSGGAPAVLATNDGGNTWDLRPGSGFDLEEISFVTPEQGFAISSGSIFRTTDGGETWSFVYGTADCTFNAIAFASADGGWATGQGKGGPCLYHSRDGGDSWEISFEGVTAPALAHSFDQFFLVRGEFDEQRVSWANESCSGTSLEFVDAKKGWLVIGCRSYFSGGFLVLRTANGGESWEGRWGPTTCIMSCQTATGGLFPLFFLDFDHVWRQGPQTVLRSTDGGETWSGPPELGQCCSYLPGRVFFVDESHGWIAAPNAELGFTEDGGESWEFRPVVVDGS